MEFDYSILQDICSKLDSLEQLDKLIDIVIALGYINFAMLLANIIFIFKKR